MNNIPIVTVQGYSGFIGSHFTRRVLDLGWIVYGVDLNHYTEAGNEFQNYNNFIVYGDDICDLNSLPDCDYVINFAAATHVSHSIHDCKEFIRTNVDGVRNILDILRKRPKNVVKNPILMHISTDEIYGDIEVGKSSKEDDLLNPSNPYSASKAMGDLLIQSYARTYGLEYLIVRPTNNYGTHQLPEKLIPLTIKLAKWGQQIRLHNNGEPTRMWLHVEDTVDALLTLILTNSRGIYNVSGNLEQTNLMTVTKILKQMNFTDEQIKQRLDLRFTREGQDYRYSVDDSKLKSLGWKCKRSFDEELSNIISWYLQDPTKRLF